MSRVYINKSDAVKLEEQRERTRKAQEAKKNLEAQLRRRKKGLLRKAWRVIKFW